MRVFVAGGTGALGQHLLPQLVAAGHNVSALTRSAGKAAAVESAGAEPVVADALDREALVAAVREVRPEVVIHQLTALISMKTLRRFDKGFALTNRLRTEGTDNLLVAAQSAGASRFIAQSFAGWPSERTGSRVKAEDAPFDPAPPADQRRSMAAIKYLERQVTGAPLEGVVLRYGGFYGPGTGDFLVEAVRKRQVPVIGGGAGIWSFIEITDAAAATLAAAEGGAPGIYNVVDDDPAPVADWLPYLAQVAGAKPPLRLPAWLGRLLAGEFVVAQMTTSRGSSNQKARKELGWEPRYASWREGFRAWVSG